MQKSAGFRGTTAETKIRPNYKLPGIIKVKRGASKNDVTSDPMTPNKAGMKASDLPKSELQIQDNQSSEHPVGERIEGWDT